MRPVPEITAEQENFRVVPFLQNMTTIKRDPVEPVPVGTVVARAFRVTGYDPDCDGSLMARVEALDADGEPTGWTEHSIGLWPDSWVVLDDAGELHRLAGEVSPECPVTR